MIVNILMNRITQIIALIQERYTCDEYVARVIFGGRIGVSHSMIRAMSKQKGFSPRIEEKLQAVETFFREAKDYELRCPYIPASEGDVSRLVRLMKELARIVEYYENCLPVKSRMDRLHRRFVVQNGEIYLKDGKVNPYARRSGKNIVLSAKDLGIIELADEIRKARESGELRRTEKSGREYTARTGKPYKLTPAKSGRYWYIGRPRKEDIFYLYEDPIQNDGKRIQLFKNDKGKWSRRRVLKTPVKKGDELYPDAKRVRELLTLEENWFEDYKVSWNGSEFSGLEARGAKKSTVRLVLPVRIQSVTDDDVRILSAVCPATETPLMASYAAWLYKIATYKRPNKPLTELIPDVDMMKSLIECMEKIVYLWQQKLDKAIAVSKKFRKNK